MISPMRISGLSSGLDIDSMVNQLMQAERMPVNRLYQKKQLLEWQRDSYREMNSLLLSLRDTVAQMMRPSTYQTKKASSSNETAVTVSATTGAAEGIYKIKINQLATAASLTSGDVIAGAGNSSATLGSLGLTADTTLTVSGEKGTATIQVKTTDTISNLVNAVNAKSYITGVSLSYDSNLDTFFFVSKTTGASTKVDLRSADFAAGQNLITNIMKFTGTGTVNGEIVSTSGAKTFSGTTDVIDSSITTPQTLRITDGTNNYDFTVTNTTTIGQLIDSINGSALGKLGVSAYLDNGKLVLSNPDPSKNYTFSDQTADATDILVSLGLDGAIAETPTTYLQSLSWGTDAQVVFNGVSGNYSSNTFTINGINFTAKAVTAADVDITVGKDVDAVFNSIKSFIDKYNETIDKINGKLSEKRYRDYPPLTPDQKKEMKDNEIALWEEKAKSGLLQSDSILTSGLTSLRRALYDQVTGLPSGSINQLAQIGIDTGYYLEKGKLYIKDEAKLRDALTTKPDEVISLFTADDGVKTSDAGDGLAVRLYDKISDTMKKLTDKAGSNLSFVDNSLIGKDLNRINEQIDKFNAKLIDIENRYYRQFTAMEKAINRANMQSAWLAQQFGGGQG